MVKTGESRLARLRRARWRKVMAQLPAVVPRSQVPPIARPVTKVMPLKGRVTTAKYFLSETISLRARGAQVFLAQEHKGVRLMVISLHGQRTK